MNKSLAALVLLACASCVLGSCAVSNPVTYTTRDASNLFYIAYIQQFTLSCPQVKGSLYAVDDRDNILQAAIVGENKWQISFVKELKDQTKGDHVLNLYNEDGISAVRKKQTASPVASVTINHGGAYNGPWLSSEHLAAILGVAVGYLAISGKSKLLG